MNIAVIFAGGVGSRMNTKDRPKQFLMVHGKPIIVHTIEYFEYHDEIDGIVVVCVSDWIPYMEEMKYRFRLDKIGKIVPGGETGQMSIYNGLKAAQELYGLEENIVLIHDGARPFVDETIIRAAYQDALEYGASCTAVPVKDTIKVAGEGVCIADTPDRRLLYAAQTPQTFRISLILQAYEALTALSPKEIADMQITDDAMVVERMLSKQVKLSRGSYENIKVTTPEDLTVAEGILSRRMK